jgi:hypothetical protein
LQQVEPFLSAEDIEKGAKWRQVISGELREADLAIICLTPENLNSPWLLFEAGAVAKHDQSRVWTYLFGLKPTDIADPFSEFQHTLSTKEDTKKLLFTINEQVVDGKLPRERLTKVFDMWWPQLEKNLTKIPGQVPGDQRTKDPLKRMLEMTTEILQRVRESAHQAVFDSRDVYDDAERVDISSVISSALLQRLKDERIPFSGVGTCTNGGYAIFQADKSWRIEKSVAEDLALGRISLSEMFSASRQKENPCGPDLDEGPTESDIGPSDSRVAEQDHDGR